MTTYVIRRLFWALIVLIGISLITFLVMFSVPADPAKMIAGPNASPGAVATVRHQLGLDQPLPVQYLRYMGRVIHGDLGHSTSMSMDVGDAIKARFPYTLVLAIGGLLVELLIGLPIGIVSALKQYSLLDRAGMLLSLVGISAPSFWLGLILMIIFAFNLSWFPLGGTTGRLPLVLPALTIGLGGAAFYVRLLRSSMLDILGADFVRTARAKGLPERIVISRHVIPNAVNTVITQAGMDLAFFLGGVVIVEQVFAWPGLGQMSFDAIQSLDVNLIMGTVLFAAFIIVMANILVDISYAVLDPRVRYG
jgi:peptide/nickel transport system permease protein